MRVVCLNRNMILMLWFRRDSQFWKGHFGMKFARACVTVQCLENDPEDESEIEADEGETGHEDSSSDFEHYMD